MQPVKRWLVVDDKPRPKSNFAQIASASVAIVALAGIYVQVELNRKNTLRSSARQVYLSYSQASLQYPRLAYPNYKQLKSSPDPTEFMRYKMYVAVMLTAYDEILQIVDDPEWISAFKYDIVDHMPYLCEVTDLKYYESFYRYTRELIAGLKSDYCSEIASILERAPSYPPEPPRPTTP